MEVGAFVEEGADKPGAFGGFFLAADENGTACAGGKGREAAVVTSGPGHPADFFVGHNISFLRGEVKLVD